MDRHFDEELQALKAETLRMGALAQSVVSAALDALVRRDAAALRPVAEREEQVNRLQIELDEACLRLIALHQPTASDLRTLMGIAKINGELERMADHGVNIAETVERLLQEPVEDFPVLPEMASTAMRMVGDVLEAVARLDAEAARRVRQRDKALNRMKDEIVDRLVERMKQDPSFIREGVRLILVARNIERIGDHVKNVAEDLVFMAEGKDIRHHHAV